MLGVIWGVNFSVIKVALAEFEPLAFNALRFPLAAATLFVLLRLRGPIPVPRREDWARVVFLGLLANVVYQFFFIFGIELHRLQAYRRARPRSRGRIRTPRGPSVR